MAITYESLLPEILPMVDGCPDTLIENNIRSSVIELCEKAKVYQQELEAVTTVSKIYEYDLEAPTGTTVHQILWVTHAGEALEPTTSSLLEQKLPRWRDPGYTGKPVFYVQQTSTLFWLAPVPSATDVSSTLVQAVLKPSHTSTSCDNDVMNDYRDAIVNGALFRLLRIPNKTWSNTDAANTYGLLFAQGVEEARVRAKRFDGVARKVNYGGIATRTRYRNRGWKTSY
jgi:hypothetical protein